MTVDPATLRPLTGPQERVRRFIIEFLQEHHRQPTLSEIAAGFGVRKSGIRQHLVLASRKGWFTYEPGRGVERMVGVSVNYFSEAADLGGREFVS